MKRLSVIGVIVVLLLALLSTPVAAKAKGEVWQVPGDFATIQAAINSPTVNAGDTINVGPGSHAGALVTKAVAIRGIDGAVINSGPAHGSGLIMGFRLLAGSGGTTISHLAFTVDLAIMNGAAVNDVNVEQCTFTNTVQGVSNWRGNGWVISHNKFVDLRTSNGGGIGILVGDYTGGTVENNVVSHNDISGTLHVPSIDGGGYNGSGIVLYADFRYGGLGATAITNNRVVQNKVSLVSDKPLVVDVVALELTDSRNNPALTPVIFDNSVGFNDFRGTALQIDLTPDNLDTVNNISRNLGENRSHGLHPSLFGPGGN